MSKFVLWFLLLLLLCISPFFGAVELHFSDILNKDSLAFEIFTQLRLPRLFFTFFAGAILSLGGVLFQTLFRNPLMTPYTLGVSSGATLGAGIAIKLALPSLFGIASVTLFGFIGAVATIVLLLFFSRFLKESQQNSLLLLGVALSFFYNSALMVVFYLGNTIQNDMLIRFTMGSLLVVGWSATLLLGVVAVIFTLSIYLYRFDLQLLGVSKESAKLKGVESKKVLFLLLLVTSFAIGATVSICGPIGFVGLIVPHIVTKIYPLTIEKRIIKSALFGGFFLLLCDTISRTLPTQSELPIGIVTTLLGGPFFIYLIISQKKSH